MTAKATPLKSTPWDVVFALIMREIKTRAGNHQLGYLTNIAEPVVHIIVLMFLLENVGRALLPGIDMTVFLTVGVMHFFYFRVAVDRIGSAVTANKALMFYRQVQPIYAVFARTIVELFVHISTFSILLVLGLALDKSFSVNDLGLLLVTNGIITLLAFGTGLTIAVFHALSTHTRLISANVIRVLYYISCVFYPYFLLPGPAKVVAQYNPVIHVMELARASLVPGYYLDPAMSVAYPAAWALGMAVLGMGLYRMFSKRLLEA